MKSLRITEEQEIDIQGPCGNIQSGYIPGDQKKIGLLVCHPHPLHEGTMFNKVVTTVCQAGKKLGLNTVRFNYRGVGMSAGSYDHAIGEIDDAEAVGKWLLEQSTCTQLCIVGFSFGAFIAYNCRNRLPGNDCIMICPSVENMHFSPVPMKACHVIQAGSDEIVNPNAVQSWTKYQQNTSFTVIPDASHFFHGKLVQLQETMRTILQEAISAT